ncbi:MAG: dual specificity protein phosphatase family protein [Chloroflexota bacterium]
MNLPLPNPNSYWVESGQFLAGEYPGNFDEAISRHRLLAYLKVGITDFIDLTRPHELPPYDAVLRDLGYIHDIQVSHTRLSIRDFSIPSKETMQTILNTIDGLLDQGRKIYVHCWGGVGRTGTVVGCYLVRRGMSGEQALSQIAEWWKEIPKRIHHPRSPETEVQMEFVRRWARYQESLGGQ